MPLLYSTPLSPTPGRPVCGVASPQGETSALDKVNALLVQAGLELTLQFSLASALQSACLGFLTAGILSMWYHAWLKS